MERYDPNGYAPHDSELGRLLRAAQADWLFLDPAKLFSA
jgi:hypothetical protein